VIGRPPGRARRRRATLGRSAIGLAVALVACAPADAQREPGWDVRVTERVELAIGQAASLTIALAVDRGLAVSKDAAVILDLAPDDGVTVKKRRLGRGDAVDPDADAPRFAIAIRGEAPGDHAVRVHVRFWLCGARSCRPIDVQRVAIIAVAAATAGDAGVDAATGARDAAGPPRAVPGAPGAERDK
jgi:hypothetical protein